MLVLPVWSPICHHKAFEQRRRRRRRRRRRKRRRRRRRPKCAI